MPVDGSFRDDPVKRTAIGEMYANAAVGPRSPKIASLGPYSRLARKRQLSGFAICQAGTVSAPHGASFEPRDSPVGVNDIALKTPRSLKLLQSRHQIPLPPCRCLAAGLNRQQHQLQFQRPVT